MTTEMSRKKRVSATHKWDRLRTFTKCRSLALKIAKFLQVISDYGCLQEIVKNKVLRKVCISGGVINWDVC